MDDFTIEGIKNASFPNFTQDCIDIGGYIKQGQPEKEPFIYFGVQYKKHFYFISTNPSALVSKQIIDEGPKSLESIPDSQILNVHVYGDVQGTQATKI